MLGPAIAPRNRCTCCDSSVSHLRGQSYEKMGRQPGHTDHANMQDEVQEITFVAHVRVGSPSIRVLGHCHPTPDPCPLPGEPGNSHYVTNYPGPGGLHHSLSPWFCEPGVPVGHRGTLISALTAEALAGE